MNLREKGRFLKLAIQRKSRGRTRSKANQKASSRGQGTNCPELVKQQTDTREAIPMEHQALVIPGSIKSSAVGGVEFIVRCCEKHEKSVHIQHPGKHTQEELLRIRDQH